MRRRARSRLASPFDWRHVSLSNRSSSGFETEPDPLSKKSRKEEIGRRIPPGSFSSSGRNFSVVQAPTAVPDGREDAALGHLSQQRHLRRSPNKRTSLHGCTSMLQEARVVSIRSDGEGMGHPHPRQTVHRGQGKQFHGGRMIHRSRWAEWKSMEQHSPRNSASDCIRNRCMWTWERVAKHTLNRMEKGNGRCPRIPHQGHPP